jgi:hypothetical protein
MPAMDQAEGERRKQQIRDLWAYRPSSHIPIWMTVYANPDGYSVREQFESAGKHLAVQLASVDRTLSCVPDDILPVLHPSLVSGNETGVALGAEVYWGKDPEQSPSIEAPRVRSAADVWSLASTDWRGHPLVSAWLERIAFFGRETDWPLSLNLIGPTDTALAISEAVWFYESIATEPKVVEDLYQIVLETTSGLVDMALEAAGDRERVVGIGARLWCPEDRLGYVSDDVATAISPAAYQSLNRPANDRIFERYGRGVLHVCGPHPNAEGYLGGAFPPAALTVSWRYSEAFFVRLSKALAGKAVIYLELTDYQVWDDPDFSPLVARYRRAVSLFAPTTLAVAYLQVGEAVDAPALYAALRKVSEQYASEMDWPAGSA